MLKASKIKNKQFFYGYFAKFAVSLFCLSRKRVFLAEIRYLIYFFLF